MKLMGFVPILLLLGVGITSGIAAGQVSVGAQVVPPTAQLGETVSVMLSLSKAGGDPVEVTVRPNLPPGVLLDSTPGEWKVIVTPGPNPTPISYPIRADLPGNYIVTTQISYIDEGGQPTNLNMGAMFDVIPAPEMTPEEVGTSEVGTSPEGDAPLPNGSVIPGGLPGISDEFGGKPGSVDLPPGHSGPRPGPGPEQPDEEGNGSDGDAPSDLPA